MTDLPRLMTVAEAAPVLRLRPYWVRHLLKVGKTAPAAL